MRISVVELVPRGVNVVPDAQLCVLLTNGIIQVLLSLLPCHSTSLLGPNSYGGNRTSARPRTLALPLGYLLWHLSPTHLLLQLLSRGNVHIMWSLWGFHLHWNTSLPFILWWKWDFLVHISVSSLCIHGSCFQLGRGLIRYCSCFSQQTEDQTLIFISVKDFLCNLHQEH